MAFQICTVTGAQGLDALPVAKITGYPMEERDYRPFAQAILCVDKETSRLILRMWAFEVSPLPGSELRAVLYLFAQNPALALHCTAVMQEDGVPAYSALLKGKSTPEKTASSVFHAYSGEDLQGVYWGMECALPISALEELGGSVLLAPGDSFPGNFYKTCPHPERPHYGSFTPACWDAPCTAEGMDVLSVVDY